MYAQLHTLKVIQLDSALQNQSILASFTATFPNAPLCKAYYTQIPLQLQAKGYIGASIDSVNEQKNATVLYLYIGKQYRWDSLQVADKDQLLLQQCGLNINKWNGSLLNITQLPQLPNSILKYLENNGYPFAKVSFKEVQINKEKVNAALQIDKGIYYILDSIRIWGNVRLSKNYLHRFLGLLPSDGFSAVKLEKIQQRINEIPFLQQQKPWDINMLASSYVLNTYLQPKKSNQVNVLVGLLPANNNLGDKLLLTGEANLLLQNTFAKGESIKFNWQQLQNQSPRLVLGFERPYILNSNAGLDALLEIYKRDSSFVNVHTQLGLQYLINANHWVKVGLETFATNIISVDTLSVVVNRKLPDVVDVSITGLKAEWYQSATNYKFNPVKGYEISVLGSFGNKTIKKNNAIVNLKTNNFNYASLYDTINLKTYQLKLQTQLAKYFPIGKQSTIKTAINGGAIIGKSIFRNELFQIGGAKLLRGFNEETILASSFAVVTAEYRYLLALNAYFNVFTDVALVKNVVYQQQTNYWGTGAGLALETKQGIINVSLAVGKQSNLPFSFKEAKFHIGFVSFF